MNLRKTGGSDWKLVLRAALSVTLVVGLVWWVGPQELWSVAVRAHLGWLSVAIALTILSLLAGGLSILILTRALAPQLSSAQVMRAYLGSWSAGTLTPARLGDFALAPLLASSGVGHGLGLAVIFVDKLVSFAVMATIACFGLVAYAQRGQAILAGVLSAAIIVGAATVIKLPGIRKAARRLLLGRHEAKFEGFAEHVASFAQAHKSALGLNTAWTVIRSLLQATVVWAMLASFGENVDILAILFINTLAALSTVLPISVGGIGLRQGAAVALFEFFTETARAPVLNAYLILQVSQYMLAGLALAWTRTHDHVPPAD